MSREQDTTLTLGSLFDGSGGFPLAASLCGIEPVWASEIEPYPIAVTRTHFPRMRHLGDIHDIRGSEIEPVDVISFGSPCQDLSVAGKRAGIHEGARSNLFFEAIRVIREMRGETNGKYPTFAIWENVPGAFSSNSGEDFRCVLEALARVKDLKADIPLPDKGKWSGAGAVMGDGWSIAWRVLDAQYWGVPQRRRRIYLVADFAGGRAGKILFERESVRGDFTQSGETREGTSDNASGSAGRSNSLKCLNPWDCQSKRIFEPDGIYPTLTAMDCGGANNQAVLYALDSMSSNSMKSSNPHSSFHAEKITKTLQAGGADPTCNQGGNVIVELVYALQGNSIDRGQNVVCVQNTGYGWWNQEDIAETLRTPAGGDSTKANLVVECYDARGNCDVAHVPTLTGDHENRVTDYTAICIGNGQLHQTDMGDKTGALNCMHDQQAVITSGKPQRKYIVRRLIPLECGRLQGFPDGWGDTPCKDYLSDDEYQFWLEVRNTHASVNGKAARDYTKEQMRKWYNGLHTDSAEYKMWGNGIALPCAIYVMEGVAQYC